MSGAERDINDVFDDIVKTEDSSSHTGYSEGFEKGQSDGNTEGFHLGYHRGAEIGAEIGFYMGVVKHFLLQETLTERIKLQLERLQKDLLEFPRSNVEDIDYLAKLEHIKASYKKVATQLKFNSRYPELDQTNF